VAVKNLTCIDCNKPFILDEDTAVWYERKRMPAPKRCPDCRADMKSLRQLLIDDINAVIPENRICALCAKPYTLTKDEIHNFLSGIDLIPRRCWLCRRVRKGRKKGTAATGN
jgi:hypothetical protein